MEEVTGLDPTKGYCFRLGAVIPQGSGTTTAFADTSVRGCVLPCATGIVRLGDLVRMPAGARAQQRLRDRARPISEVPTTRPDEDLAALLQRIGPGLEQRVLVFDKGQLVGIVSPADVARVLAVRQTLGTSAKPPATTASRGPL